MNALAELARALLAAGPREVAVPLWASEVGAYLGVDKWMRREEALGAVWRRTNGAQYASVLAAHRATGLPLAGAAPAADPWPHVKTAADVEAFCATASPGLARQLYSLKGQLNEEVVAQGFEARVGRPVTDRHASVCWSSEWDTGVCRPDVRPPRPPGPLTDPGPFTLVGEVDGWVDGPAEGQRSVVEFKLRLRSLPAAPPERDLLQVQTYLHINDVDTAFYVQGLYGAPDTVRVQEVARDRQLWAGRILPGLVAFVCDVRRLMRGAPEDGPLRAAVLRASDKLPPPMAASLPARLTFGGGGGTAAAADGRQPRPRPRVLLSSDEEEEEEVPTEEEAETEEETEPPPPPPPPAKKQRRQRPPTPSAPLPPDTVRRYSLRSAHTPK